MTEDHQKPERGEATTNLLAELLSIGKPASTYELAGALDWDYDRTRWLLDHCLKTGYVEKLGTRRTYSYQITDAGRHRLSKSQDDDQVPIDAPKNKSSQKKAPAPESVAPMSCTISPDESHVLVRVNGRVRMYSFVMEV